MSAPAILIGKHCRLCRALIPLSIAAQHGSEENGYLCIKCLEDYTPKLHALESQVTDFWVSCDRDAPPCAICTTTEGEDRVLENIDGALGLICLPCERQYIRANRDKIRGTKLEFDLKLR